MRAELRSVTLISIFGGLVFSAGTKVEIADRRSFDSQLIEKNPDPGGSRTAEPRDLSPPDYEEPETDYDYNYDYYGEQGPLKQRQPPSRLDKILPLVTFECSRGEGYYADAQFECDAFHYCGADGTRFTFLCGEGSKFNQKTLICDFDHNLECKEDSALSSPLEGRSDDQVASTEVLKIAPKSQRGNIAAQRPAEFGFKEVLQLNKITEHSPAEVPSDVQQNSIRSSLPDINLPLRWRQAEAASVTQIPPPQTSHRRNDQPPPSSPTGSGAAPAPAGNPYHQVLHDIQQLVRETDAFRLPRLPLRGGITADEFRRPVASRRVDSTSDQYRPTPFHQPLTSGTRQGRQTDLGDQGLLALRDIVQSEALPWTPAFDAPSEPGNGLDEQGDYGNDRILLRQSQRAEASERWPIFRKSDEEAEDEKNDDSQRVNGRNSPGSLYSIHNVDPGRHSDTTAYGSRLTLDENPTPENPLYEFEDSTRSHEDDLQLSDSSPDNHEVFTDVQVPAGEDEQGKKAASARSIEDWRGIDDDQPLRGGQKKGTTKQLLTAASSSSEHRHRQRRRQLVVRNPAVDTVRNLERQFELLGPTPTRFAFNSPSNQFANNQFIRVGASNRFPGIPPAPRADQHRGEAERFPRPSFNREQLFDGRRVPEQQFTQSPTSSSFVEFDFGGRDGQEERQFEPSLARGSFQSQTTLRQIPAPHLGREHPRNQAQAVTSPPPQHSTLSPSELEPSRNDRRFSSFERQSFTSPVQDKDDRFSEQPLDEFRPEIQPPQPRRPADDDRSRSIPEGTREFSDNARVEQRPPPFGNPNALVATRNRFGYDTFLAPQFVGAFERIPPPTQTDFITQKPVPFQRPPPPPSPSTQPPRRLSSLEPLQEFSLGPGGRQPAPNNIDARAEQRVEEQPPRSFSTFRTTNSPFQFVDSGGDRFEPGSFGRPVDNFSPEVGPSSRIPSRVFSRERLPNSQLSHEDLPPRHGNVFINHANFPAPVVPFTAPPILFSQTPQPGRAQHPFNPPRFRGDAIFSGREPAHFLNSVPNSKLRSVLPEPIRTEQFRQQTEEFSSNHVNDLGDSAAESLFPPLPKISTPLPDSFINGVVSRSTTAAPWRASSKPSEGVTETVFETLATPAVAEPTIPTSTTSSPIVIATRKRVRSRRPVVRARPSRVNSQKSSEPTPTSEPTSTFEPTSTSEPISSDTKPSTIPATTQKPEITSTPIQLQRIRPRRPLRRRRPTVTEITTENTVSGDVVSSAVTNQLAETIGGSAEVTQTLARRRPAVRRRPVVGTRSRTRSRVSSRRRNRPNALRQLADSENESEETQKTPATVEHEAGKSAVDQSVEDEVSTTGRRQTRRRFEGQFGRRRQSSRLRSTSTTTTTTTTTTTATTTLVPVEDEEESPADQQKPEEVGVEVAEIESQQANPIIKPSGDAPDSPSLEQSTQERLLELFARRRQNRNRPLLNRPVRRYPVRSQTNVAEEDSSRFADSLDFRFGVLPSNGGDRQHHDAHVEPLYRPQETEGEIISRHKIDDKEPNSASDELPKQHDLRSDAVERDQEPTADERLESSVSIQSLGRPIVRSRRPPSHRVHTQSRHGTTTKPHTLASLLDDTSSVTTIATTEIPDIGNLHTPDSSSVSSATDTPQRFSGHLSEDDGERLATRPRIPHHQRTHRPLILFTRTSVDSILPETENPMPQATQPLNKLTSVLSTSKDATTDSSASSSAVPEAPAESTTTITFVPFGEQVQDRTESEHDEVVYATPRPNFIATNTHMLPIQSLFADLR